MMQIECCNIICKCVLCNGIHHGYHDASFVPLNPPEDYSGPPSGAADIITTTVATSAPSEHLCWEYYC